ncbi:MAG: DUF4136 domain-containing protein [Desulfobacterales bacterium]|nr:DUF4136 domain-containing protein [Desulfobacterales bacterium]
MSGFYKFLVLGLVVVFSGCAATIEIPQTVTWDYNVNKNFSTLRTYDVGPIPSTIGIEHLMLERIQAAIHTTLQAKNVQRSPQNPDFLVTIYGVRSKIFTTAWRGFDSDLIVEKGKLILQFVDPKTRRVIWWGETRALLDPDRNPAVETQTVNEVVHRILAKFPPFAS